MQGFINENEVGSQNFPSLKPSERRKSRCQKREQKMEQQWTKKRCTNCMPNTSKSGGQGKNEQIQDVHDKACHSSPTSQKPD